MRPQMMRPSELLRMLYAHDRNETSEIYPVVLQPYKTPDGRWMYNGIVTANVNAIIAVACYQERLSGPKHSSEHEEYERTKVGLDIWREIRSPFGDKRGFPQYRPHRAIPWSWAVLGGL